MAAHARWQPETANPLPQSGPWHAKRLIGPGLDTHVTADSSILAACCRAASRRRRPPPPPPDTANTAPACSLQQSLLHCLPSARCPAWTAQFTPTRCGRCSNQQALSRRSVAAGLGGDQRCTMFAPLAASLTLFRSLHEKAQPLLQAEYLFKPCNPSVGSSPCRSPRCRRLQQAAKHPSSFGEALGLLPLPCGHSCQAHCNLLAAA